MPAPKVDISETDCFWGGTDCVFGADLTEAEMTGNQLKSIRGMESKIVKYRRLPDKSKLKKKQTYVNFNQVTMK